MTDFTFPSGNIGGAPVSSLTSNVLLSDGTRTGSATVASLLALNTNRTVTAAGAVTAALTDAYIFIKKTSGAATTVNLPTGAAAGFLITIKDTKGDAFTNNITVVPGSGTIDGASSYIMNINYQANEFMFDGTNWARF